MRSTLILLALLGLQMAALAQEETSLGSDEIAASFELAFTPAEEYKNDFGSYPTMLKFYDGLEVKTPADWPARRAEILKFWHDAMGPWPKLLERPEVVVLESENVENYTRSRVSVQVDPALKTEGWLLIPEGEGSFPAVLTVFYTAGQAAGVEEKTRGIIDFGRQMSLRGFVTLNIGIQPEYERAERTPMLQPLSYLAYVAANCHTALSQMPQVDGERIGVIGHSYGGKWAVFASCLYDKFAAAVWSDPGIVFDEKRGNVNYWERWYLGLQEEGRREPGMVTGENPRTGAYKMLYESGHDLIELHALMAPRPFLVSGGSEDHAERWQALNRIVEVNKFLGYEDRVALTTRDNHRPDPESLAQICHFFVRFLGDEAKK